jgi:CubicO group peptidase (beta-lactamase class C family)
LPAGSVYDYGGSQWQLAGLVAEQVTSKPWREIVEHYLVEPCALEVFEFGNMWSSLGAWDGTPDSLRGQSNPHIGGGAISNMRDYAKILMAHLRGGWCGGNRILSIDGVEKLQTNRTEEFRRNYGMGWRISYSTDKTPYLYWDPGAFGAVAWIDTLRGIGGYMAIDDYDTSSSSAAINLLIFEIIPLIESAVDAARGKSP